VEIGRRRLLDLRGTLRDEENPSLLFHRRVQRSDRRRPPDKEGRDDIRKEHEIAQREHWKPLTDLEALRVADISGHDLI